MVQVVNNYNGCIQAEQVDQLHLHLLFQMDMRRMMNTKQVGLMVSIMDIDHRFTGRKDKNRILNLLKLNPV